jgi:hypothetical protein
MQPKEYESIKAALLNATTADPLALAREVMEGEGLAVNGPIHHFLEGAAFLAAFRNAGGRLNLPRALEMLAVQAARIPEGVCDDCGTCGAVTSVATAMAIIRKMTGAIDGDRYRAHMQYTARALAEIAALGGPRCCKRNGFVAITLGARFLNESLGTALTLAPTPCPFSAANATCLGAKCPFFGGKKEPA